MKLLFLCALSVIVNATVDYESGEAPIKIEPSGDHDSTNMPEIREKPKPLKTESDTPPSGTNMHSIPNDNDGFGHIIPEGYPAPSPLQPTLAEIAQLKARLLWLTTASAECRQQASVCESEATLSQQKSAQYRKQASVWERQADLIQQKLTPFCSNAIEQPRRRTAPKRKRNQLDPNMQNAVPKPSPKRRRKKLIPKPQLELYLQPRELIPTLCEVLLEPKISEAYLSGHAKGIKLDDGKYLSIYRHISGILAERGLMKYFSSVYKVKGKQRKPGHGYRRLQHVLTVKKKHIVMLSLKIDEWQKEYTATETELKLLGTAQALMEKKYPLPAAAAQSRGAVPETEALQQSQDSHSGAIDPQMPKLEKV